MIALLILIPLIFIGLIMGIISRDNRSYRDKLSSWNIEGYAERKGK